MKARPHRSVLLAAALFLPARLLAVFGVGDTSFVTVIANPAEAANWASQIRSLEAQLAAMRSTLAEIEAARAIAGDPRSAVQAATGVPALLAADAGLLRLPSAAATIAAGSPVAVDDPALALLVARLAGQGEVPGTMSVQGSPVPRDLSRYVSAATAVNTAQAMQGQLAREQQSRVLAEGDLAAAWTDFQGATTETQKQAALTRVTELEALDRLAGSRRSGELADLALSDRGERAQQQIAARAADEQAAADSAALQAKNAARRQAADAARQAVLAEVPDAPAARDYAGLRLWTPADGGGP